MAAEEYGVARLSHRTQGVLYEPRRRAICMLFGRWLLLVLAALFLVPEDAISLDCDYAIKLYDAAERECEAGVRYEGVKYQPCEYMKLLEKSYRTCAGEQVEEPQSEFGLVMVRDKLVGGSDLFVAASQEGYEEAKLTALKGCMMRGGKADRCKEIARFAGTCFAVARGQGRYGTDHIFTTAEGNSRGHAEIEAIRRCEERVPQTSNWTLVCKYRPSGCSSADIICAIKASGCSPYEVVASMEEFRFRAPQTMDQVSKIHEKADDKLEESKIREEWSKAERSQKNRAWVKGIQLGLTKHGFSPGPIDGIFGLNTYRAIRKWQEGVGEPTGTLTPEQEKLLMNWDFMD